MVYHAGLTTETTRRLRRMKIIALDELLFGGFRIYVECAAESSDVRPVGRGALYAPDRLLGPVPVDSALPGFTTAYERVDDRIFPGDVRPW